MRNARKDTRLAPPDVTGNFTTAKQLGGEQTMLKLPLRALSYGISAGGNRTARFQTA